ncbi:hypothetical protein D3P08_21880 [Paenibacillus nanensis]|uniref:Uncharacterized protein n=1 Tax=Paenibacillus nanensis TaxID=393251 RepID=A0A3A1URX0_9BACL|nr:hypothetical protein [Paenibacillus nanensis]RIX49922.1 hypothetical protein D3P08_21880 [Paenibacillus nanensis]
MNETIKTSFWVMLYSVLAGTCLALFMIIPSFEKYLFSLLSIYIAIRYFRRFETIGKRILFLILALFFSFFTVFCVTAYRYVKNPEQFAVMFVS